MRSSNKTTSNDSRKHQSFHESTALFVMNRFSKRPHRSCCLGLQLQPEIDTHSLECIVCIENHRESLRTKARAFAFESLYCQQSVQYFQQFTLDGRNWVNRMNYVNQSCVYFSDNFLIDYSCRKARKVFLKKKTWTLNFTSSEVGSLAIAWWFCSFTKWFVTVGNFIL